VDRPTLRRAWSPIDEKRTHRSHRPLDLDLLAGNGAEVLFLGRRDYEASLSVKRIIVSRGRSPSCSARFAK